MIDLPNFRVTQISALFLAAMVSTSSNATFENSEQTSSTGQSEQCLQLPKQGMNFGDIDHWDIEEWMGLEDWQFTTNANYLSVEIDDGGEPYLRQKVEPNHKGSVRVLARGELPPASTYSLQQSFFLEPGFDWGGKNEGGKLGFGLGGGTTPTGGMTDQDGFTARLMWRGNGDGSARLAIYSYSADRSQNLPYGDDYPVQDFQIPIGQWFTVTMQVSANSTTGSADGSVRVWVDDLLKLQQDNVHWQARGEKPVIDHLLYATFHGGNSVNWSPDETVYARFSSICWQPTEFTPVVDNIVEDFHHENNGRN